MITARKRHILEEHYLDFYSRAIGILNDEDDAKDAVQEAVVKTLIRVGVHDMVAYCFRATERECINILRHRRKMMQYDEVTIETSHEEEELKRQLRDSRRLLLPLERRVLELRRDHGYSNNETATKVGLSVSTVKRLLANAEMKITYTMTHEI